MAVRSPVYRRRGRCDAEHSNLAVGASNRGQRGWIYFLGGADLTKVGWTAGSVPLNRIEGLRRENAIELAYYGALPGWRRLEYQIHEAMALWRRHGEWFVSNPVLDWLFDVLRRLGPVESSLGFPADLPPELAFYRLRDVREWYGGFAA